MNVLITGSAGRLGTVVVNRLRNAGYKVTGADLIMSSTTDVVLDIRNEEQVWHTVKNFDAIVHTAALHGRHYDLGFSRQAFIHTNICGTLNLLNVSVQTGVKKFLYISTTSIYGNAMVNPHQAVWVDETLTEQPRDIYDITKQTAEQLCKDFFYKEGLQTSVYRVGRFLPEDDNLKANHRLYRGLDERDGAEAIFLALQQNFQKFEVFNIASTSPFSKDDLVALKKNPAAIITNLYPNASEVYHAKGWTFPQSIDRVYVTQKAKELLGYTPQYAFDYLLKS